MERTKAPLPTKPTSLSIARPRAPSGGGADNKAGSLLARKEALPRPAPVGGELAPVGEQLGSLGIRVK